MCKYRGTSVSFEMGISPSRDTIILPERNCSGGALLSWRRARGLRSSRCSPVHLAKNPTGMLSTTFLNGLRSNSLNPLHPDKKLNGIFLMCEKGVRSMDVRPEHPFKK